MAEAARARVDGIRPGMVTVVQTANDDMTFNPHIHGIASRGGWDDRGRWIPVPYVHTATAENLFRHKVLSLLKKKGLLSDQRIELLDSWRHSGFSVHNSVTVLPEDADGIERMARYLLHAPLNLDRLHFDQDSGTVAYRSKHRRRTNSLGTTYDPLDFLARLLMHVPEPRLHTVRYTGAYSSVSRARRRAGRDNEPAYGTASADDDSTSAAQRRRLRRQWAQMIRRIFEVIAAGQAADLRLRSDDADHLGAA